MEGASLSLSDSDIFVLPLHCSLFCKLNYRFMAVIQVVLLTKDHIVFSHDACQLSPKFTSNLLLSHACVILFICLFFYWSHACAIHNIRAGRDLFVI